MPSESENYLKNIRRAAGIKTLFLPHAIRQMSRPDRMITAREVLKVIREGMIVEDYPTDPRGRSCLLMGNDEDGNPIHVVCAAKAGYLAIITAYRPIKEEWSEDYRERKIK